MILLHTIGKIQSSYQNVLEGCVVLGRKNADLFFNIQISPKT